MMMMSNPCSLQAIRINKNREEGNKMKIIYEFYKCLDCPYLTSGRTYGTDGRNGH